MADSTLTIVLSAMPPTLAGVAAVLVGLKALISSNKAVVKADEIHVLVNGRMSEVTKQLEISNIRADELQKIVARLVNVNGRSAPPIKTPEAPM